MRLQPLVAILGVLLAGCMMGPDYVRPKFDTPAEFRFEPSAVVETADTAWWKQFGDPVLDALIAEALANNLNIKVAVANVEQAAASSRKRDLNCFRRSAIRRARSVREPPKPARTLRCLS